MTHPSHPAPARAPGRNPPPLTEVLRIAFEGFALPPGDLERLLDRLEGTR